MQIETTITYTAPHGGKEWQHTTRVFTSISSQEWRENRWQQLVTNHLGRYSDDMGATQTGIDQMLFWDDDGTFLDVETAYLLWLIEETAPKTHKLEKQQ